MAATVALLSAACSAEQAPAWCPDNGDGTYRNPVLFADYSDPDAVRVGDDYYLTASSFMCAPGLPILHSKDLVNWTLIGHALPEQPPVDHFAKPRHGQGVWAPAIRHHAGRYWIYYPDPDFGLYLTTAINPAGPWSPPVLVKAGAGLIDPCPFWDDDGRLYLIHAWAKSRAGIGNLLTLHELSADGLRVLDAGAHVATNEGRANDLGAVVIDANRMPGWVFLEGPKLYKRHGWYYVFAPAGGVATGYQAVFRSRDIRGPYEAKIVMDQGNTAINGPHQGAWVDTPGGEDWFLHFQDRGPFGRVVHLQPLRWGADEWPVIGADPDGDGKGEPVLAHRKPAVAAPSAVAVPQTSDEFAEPLLGLQWQWNANPQPEWASLAVRPGLLRLACVPAPVQRNDGSPAPASHYDAPNFLLQKFPAPVFSATTVLEFHPASEGEMAGLAVFGYNYAILGLRRMGGVDTLVLVENRGANVAGAQERIVAEGPPVTGAIRLRVEVDAAALCRFAYSVDGEAFVPIGDGLPAVGDRWIGAKIGLMATAPATATTGGFADFGWFRVAGAMPRSGTP